MTCDEVALRGEHNLLNVMAACTIAAAAGLPVEAMRAGVKDLPVCLTAWSLCAPGAAQTGITTPSPPLQRGSMAAIRSFHEPLVLLAGGRDKNLPWDDFAALVRQRVDHLIVFGEAAEIILRAMETKEGCQTKDFAL